MDCWFKRHTHTNSSIPQERGNYDCGVLYHAAASWIELPKSGLEAIESQLLSVLLFWHGPRLTCVCRRSRTLHWRASAVLVHRHHALLRRALTTRHYHSILVIDSVSSSGWWQGHSGATNENERYPVRGSQGFHSEECCVGIPGSSRRRYAGEDG